MVVSYFPTSKPMSKTLQNVTDVYIIMPSLWQPHSDTYAHNESSMLDWEHNMRDWKDWEQWMALDDIPEDTGMASSLHIPTEEYSWDKDHPQDEEDQANNAYWPIPGELSPSIICPHECVNSPGPECDVCTYGATGRGFGFPRMPRIGEEEYLM